MSTRGMMGFYVDGDTKGSYNHFDSYPSGLGEDIATDVSTMLADGFDIAEAIRSLKVVDDPEHRDNEGQAYATLKSGVIPDGHRFIADSLFCEWAYIINADERTIEVYEGFQENKHDHGRYCGMDPREGYYPCALVRTIPWSMASLTEWTSEEIGRRR